MKKFLSILLAVMMVLSTVSFAAPSIAGTADVVADVPVAEVPVVETTAELAGTGWDKSGYGTLVYKVDFEQDGFELDAFTTAYAMVSSHDIASYINPDFDCNNLTTYTNAAGDGFSNAQLVTEGGNTYVTGDVNASYDGFFRLTKYNCAWPEGYYTFSVDVKAPAISSFAKQCNDTKIALTNIHDFVDAEKDVWQTVAYRTTDVVNGADIYGYFVTPNNATAGTVSYDNWEVYYRPANVTLTIAGKEYVVSTDNKVSVATLAGEVTAPAGQILAGLSLTEGGELISDQYFFEDVTLYPVFKKDTSIHPEFGKAVYIIDYEKDGIAPTYGVTDASTYVTALTDTYNKSLPMNNTFNYLNFATSAALATEDGNTYLSSVVKDGYTSYLYLSKWGQDWPEGYYTFSTEVRLGSVVNGRTVQHNNDSSLVTWVKDVDIKKANEWQTVQYQFIGKGGDLTTSFLCFNGATAGAKIDYDNVALYYKPYTADVTLIANGKEYVAEDVQTVGVSAASILEKAGVSIPYGKKPVLSETFGGESVGNTINVVMDSTYYVSYVDDDSIHPTYGKRMLLIDFENLDSVTDFGKVSAHTDDYDGNYANATINWEVGANTVVEEDGNKFIKGQQGYAQVRINNSNYANLPAGTYTMVLKTKNFGSATEKKSISSKDQKGGDSATFVDTFNDNGEWDTVAAQLPKATEDFTIYYTAPMTTDVAFDDIALYYLPDSVELTIVNGDETFTQTVSSGVRAEDLLADVAAPFGYKVALSTTPDAADALTGPLSFVSNTTLYVVTIPDETLSFDYGKAILIIDFEREDMQGWDGNSQEINNSVAQSGAQVFQSATYYDPMFQSKNYRIRFVINESPVTDQGTAVDENGNHYTSGTNTSRWPQVVSTNWGNIQAQPGTYTYMFDVKVEDCAETPNMTHNAFHDGSGVVVDAYNYVDGEWDTVAIQATMNEAGNLPKGTWGNFNFSANNVAKLSFDNTKIYYKPFTATVNVAANGEVVATKENVSTAGVLVSDLVAGIKVKGYAITGVKLGTKTYALDETVAVPCDCTVDLVLEVQEASPATPETSEVQSIRVDDPVGVRYKAAISKAEDANVTTYGFMVARASVLGENELTDEFDAKVVGYGRLDGEDLKSFYESDDEYNWFTAVLHFKTVEADGNATVEKLCDPLVARPFVVVDGEYHYGAATAPKSIFDVCVAVYGDGTGETWNDLSADQQNKIFAILDKCDTNFDNIPDHLQ